MTKWSKESIDIFVITHLACQEVFTHEVFTHERSNIQDNLTSLGNLRKLNWGKKKKKLKHQFTKYQFCHLPSNAAL